MQNTKPQILGDMFNYYNACGVMSATVTLYYNNDFREKVENFYKNQTDENLSKIFPEIADPDLVNPNNMEETRKIKEKQKKIAIAFRNFWHSHLKNDEFCTPFGKIWAFNRLAEALELPRRMYVPSKQHYYSGQKTDKLIEACEKYLKDEVYNPEGINQCNKLWKDIRGNSSYKKLCNIFDADEKNIVKLDDKTVISRFLKRQYPSDNKILTSQRRGPNDIFQMLMHIGARFNVSQYNTREYENEDKGFVNCVVDNKRRDHHEAFITLNENDGYGYFYDLLNQDTLERHIEPTKKQGRYQIDKSEGNKQYEMFGKEKTFIGYKQHPMALSMELKKVDPKLKERVEKYHKTSNVKRKTQHQKLKKLSYEELEKENKQLKQQLSQKGNVENYYKKQLNNYYLKVKAFYEQKRNEYEAKLQNAKKQYSQLSNSYKKIVNENSKMKKEMNWYGIRK